MNILLVDEDKDFLRESKRFLKDNLEDVLEDNIDTIHINKDETIEEIFESINTKDYDMLIFNKLPIPIDEDTTVEKRLKEYKEKYEILAENAVDIIMRINPEGVFEEITDSLEKVTGWTHDDFIGRKMDFSKVHPNFREEAAEKFMEMIATKEPSRIEYKFKHKGGHYIWIEQTHSPVFDEKGELKEIIVIARDVTERKKMESEIKDNKRRLSLLVNNLPGIAYRCKNNRDWTMEFISDGCYDLTGYKSEEIEQGRKISYGEIIYPEDRDYVYNEIQESLEKKEEYKVEYRIISKNDEIKWVWEKGTGVFTEGGEFEALEGFITEITEQKRLQKEIEGSKRIYESIYHSTLALTQEDDFEKTIKIISDQATDLIGARDCIVYKADDEGQELIPIYTNNKNYSDKILDFNIPFGEGVVGKSIEKGKTLFVNHDEEDPYSMHITGTDKQIDDEESIISAPLFDEEKPIGAIILGKLHTNFDRSDIKTLNIFAREAELAIKRAENLETIQRSKDRLQRNIEKIKKLHETAVKFENSKSEKEIYEITIESAEKILDFDFCDIFIREGDELVVEHVSSHIPPENIKNMPLDGSLAGKTYRDNIPFILNDLSEAEELFRASDDYRSCMSVPIGYKGVFQAHSTEKEEFTEHDLEMIELLMAHVNEAMNRLEYEKDLKESERKYRLLTENLYDMISLLNTDGDVLFVNKAVINVLGFEPEELVGENIFEYFHEEDIQDNIEKWDKALSEERDYVESTERIRCKNGDYRWLESKARLLKDDNDEVDRILMVSRDITDRRKIEKELEAHRDHLEELVDERTEELQELNEQLKSFTHSVSHDLRAPLRSLQGFSNILLDDHRDKLDEPGKEYLDRVISSAQRMDKLIQDLLTYSRLTTEEMDKERVDMDRTVRKSIDQFETLIEENNVEIEIEDDLPDVKGNKRLIDQILTNLISNAIKFMEDGNEPKVAIWSEERDDKIRFWVEDNGIGIAPEKKEQIFQMFERLHGIESYPGSGVGLAIVDKCVERLGGKVGVESEVGGGSRFWVELQKA